jgi:acyl carrier protein
VTNPPTRDAVEAWLRSALSPLLRMAPAKIDGSQTFTRYGLDSITAITLAADLETWLGFRLSPTLAWEHPTLDQLATHIAALAAAQREPEHTALDGSDVAALTDAQVDALLRGILDEDGARS